MSIALLASALTAESSRAQGTIEFRTSILGATAKVLESPYFSGAGQPLGNTAAGVAPGTQFLAQLFVVAGTNYDFNSMVPIGNPVNFRAGTGNSGYVQESGTTTLGASVDPIVTIPAEILSTPGSGVTVQLRAWWAGSNGNTYPSWAAAMIFGSGQMRIGYSHPIYLPNTGTMSTFPPVAAPLLTNLIGFHLLVPAFMPPMIQSSPESLTVGQGATALFTVTTTGPTTPVNYRWRKAFIPLPNSISQPVFTIGNVTAADAGTYDVIVIDQYGQFVISSPFSLSVTSYNVGISAVNLYRDPVNVPPGLYAGLTVNGQPGQTYTIQRASNALPLTTWVSATNLTLSAPTQLWLDTNLNVLAPNNNGRFFRMLPP